MAINNEAAVDLRKIALAHWHMVNAMARKRFSAEVVAEEAALFVLETLENEHWHRLGQYSGRSRFSVFFASVTYRLLEDFARKKFGRMLPPAWIQKAGGIWLMLFRLLCLERFSFLEALAIAKDRTDQVASATLEAAAEKILAELPQCGQKTTILSLDDERARAEEPASEQRDALEKKEEQLLLGALGLIIFGTPVNDKKEKSVQKLLAHPLQLKSDERLLLRLCFQDNMSVSKARILLGLNRFQAHGKMRRTLTKIKNHFTSVGCAAELAQLLDKT